VQHPSVLQSLDLNTLQLLNFELDLLRCVFETSHKYSNCSCLPKKIATRTAHFVSKQQLVLTEVSLLQIASFTSHFDPETTSLFQAVKYETFLIKKNRFRPPKKNVYSNAFYASYPLVECRYSNFCARSTFSPVLSLSLHITTLSNYIKLLYEESNVCS
jgi:hypothetical protein